MILSLDVVKVNRFFKGIALVTNQHLRKNKTKNKQKKKTKKTNKKKKKKKNNKKKKQKKKTTAKVLLVLANWASRVMIKHSGIENGNHEKIRTQSGKY